MTNTFNRTVICSILISVITFQGIFSGSVSVEARHLADLSSSERRLCSLLGTVDSCSKFFIRTTENSGYTTKSPPPPPKAAPAPHNSPPSMTDHLFKKVTRSAPCTSSA
ncbi:uncharacterized protein LOC126798499 [Argentina anserina]|uniref:uncharacterized protein LOC126798499 n=1 Tax=Argentina anserina TaxID=57926 RepID=UPI0021763B52|nr:uncharacterized protein LOC126798499 [Potentilla anserina]